MKFGSLPRGATLFLDLDGVMADFDGAFPALFGVDHRTLPDEEMWRYINEYGTYFRDLPPCQGALRFYAAVRHLNPIILTACPPDRYADVAAQKRAWVREHLGDDVPVLPVQGGKAKPFFMHRPGDILIDDFYRNIVRWNAAGGRGLLHTDDFTATAYHLEDLLWPTIRPASDTSPAPSAIRVTTSPDTTTATASASDANTTKPVPTMVEILADRASRARLSRPSCL